MSLGLLISALALTAAPAGFAGDRIASVRVDTSAVPGTRDLSPYLAMKAGEAFDPEAVRRTVDLLYATGRFRDVVVSAAQGPEGLDVVVRPLPAPLLVRVVIEGDRIVSGAKVERIARLKRGEALWPPRLEAAAQATALALEGEGYLEARVTALSRSRKDGADAVFTIRSGPRVRVGSIRAEGATGDEEMFLRSHAPRSDVVFRRARERRAAEELGAKLVAEGYWRAKCEALETYHPDTARMDVLYRLDRGPATAVDFRGARLPSGLQARLTGVLRDGALATDVVEQVSEEIEEHFRALGYRDAFVSHREESQDGALVVVYVAEPGPQARVSAVRFSGFDAEGIEQVPETRALEPLVDRTLDDDVRRLERWLQARGYASARVEADVPAGGGSLAVTFLVRPGTRTYVKDVVEEGTTPGGLVTLRLQAGEPYRASDVALDREALLSACRNAGYPDASVAVDITLSDDRTEATVSYRVEPGQRLDVGRIVIAGLDRTRPEVVRRELTVKEGGPLSQERLLESERRLSALGIFDSVAITQIDPEGPGPRSLVVSAEEAPATTWAYGVGYAERDRFRGSLEVTRRNVLGMNRTLTGFVRGSIGGNSRLLATLREPHLFGHRLEAFATAFHEEGRRPGFDFRQSGGLLQTAFHEGSHAGFIVRFSYQKTHLFNVTIPIDEIDRQFQDSTSSGPSVSFVEDTRDDPLEPHGGRFLDADVQLSSHVFGGDSFLKSFFQASGYRRVLPRAILAVSGRVGLAWTLREGDPPRLPLPDRFFAGGDNSIRGFALDAVGPKEITVDGTVVPSGGNALLIANAELRVDAGHRISVALFADAGNVYPLVDDVTLSDVRYTAGAGLRYQSALGPFRLDWGYKLNRRPGEPASHLHVAIGHAF